MLDTIEACPESFFHPVFGSFMSFPNAGREQSCVARSLFPVADRLR
jgi:hypothetical protein